MFLDNFKIEKVSEKRPHYEVEFKMDFNDADYAWEKIDGPEKDDYFWLLVSYLNTHGTHWEKDAFLQEYNNSINFDLFHDLANLNLMLFNEDGNAHSFVEFKVFYYDGSNTKFPVKIPNIDEMFPCKECLKEALLEARMNPPTD